MGGSNLPVPRVEGGRVFSQPPGPSIEGGRVVGVGGVCPPLGIADELDAVNIKHFGTGVSFLFILFFFLHCLLLNIRFLIPLRFMSYDQIFFRTG